MDLMRGVGNFSLEAFPPKSKFNAKDVPDLSEKVALVTGGNSGIGKETVKVLLNNNAKVYMACRNKEKADAAIAELKKETGKEAIFLELDLANLKSIKQATETFASQERELHILFNNGGVMWAPMDMLTTDGYDLQFGTNVLGHFYLTKLLVPKLTEGSKSSDGRARVVTTSSIMRHFAQKIEYESLKPGPKRNKLGSKGLYAQSKFADVILSKEIARRYGEEGIVAIACAPGILKTDILRHSNPVLSWMIDTIYMYKASYGALTQLYAGTSPDAKDLNGSFLVPWARVGSAGRGTGDSKTGEELWNWLEEQVKDI
ncbi:hypothetical protein M0805_005146 [Coniferiporia weirii]|nr:hypothetical protein M0805_005146 [Coniferiporia weirii]